MDKKESKKTAVEMTAEELEAFKAFKAEQAKKEAEERVNALRDNYAAMADAFINKTIKKLSPLSKSIKAKKAEVLEEFAALQKLKADLLAIDGKEEQFVKLHEVRRVLEVMEACFISAEKKEIIHKTI